MSTLEERWKEFETNIFAGCKDIGKVQRAEIKRAFFAGMFEMFNAITGEVADLGDADKAVEQLLAFEAQFKTFLAGFYKETKKHHKPAVTI